MSLTCLAQKLQEKFFFFSAIDSLRLNSLGYSPRPKDDVKSRLCFILCSTISL